MEYFNFGVPFFLDLLSLFFLFVVFIISLPAAVYSIGYLKSSFEKPKLFWAWFLFLVFVMSMALVVTVRNAFGFLVFWEIMSLASYCLVVLDTRHEKSVQAGFIYIVMTHIGTAFLVAAFMLMYRYADSFDLILIKNACQTMPGITKSVLFLLLLVGFGTKAGIVPLHIWLPYAHPQAPSHISSLMSGVMIKTAIYGMIRFIMFVLGIDSLWWGMTVLVLAALSCVIGVIYALMEHDLKKLLAYHSVENIGIILLGVGASMVFLKLGMVYLAVFSLGAGLYHLVNHAIFKALLFLCAGSVYRGTGTRDMEKMGGLIRRMPLTSACFLCGAMAISALPPLNGFVSEWLTLQVFFLGAFDVASAGLKLFFGINAAVLALTGGLAAACFVKAFGITFLAMPRSRHASEAVESTATMKFGMCFLSVLTVIFGLAAGAILPWLAKVAGSALNVDTHSMTFALNHFVLNPQAAQNVYLSPLLLAFVLLSFGLMGAGFYWFIGKGRRSIGKVWDCGYYRLDARNEYTATAFSKPFRIAFSFFLLPYRKTQRIWESFYHLKSSKYETHTTSVFGKYVYEPMLAMVLRTARRMRRIQAGSIHLYLAYIFMALAVLILLKDSF